MRDSGRGMHARVCIQRDGSTDKDNTRKTGGCMPKHASRVMDEIADVPIRTTQGRWKDAYQSTHPEVPIRDSGRRDACGTKHVPDSSRRDACPRGCII
jgi:hypothetical protein